MEELIKVLIGIVVLLLGIPIGHYLARFTKAELKSGQRWFRLIVLVSLILGFIGLIIGDDVLLFSMFFIAVVVGGSLRKN